MKKETAAGPTVTIKYVPHPDPKRAIDVISKLVLKELNKELNKGRE